MRSSKILGGGTNYPLSSSLTFDSGSFSTPSFTSSSPTALSGGADNGGIYDAGTVMVTVAGFSATASYGSNDTTASVAASLANALSVAASPVNASATNATLTITAKNTGALTNYAFTSASTYDTGHFPHSSFSLSASGTLGGGAEAVYSLSTPAVTLYSYDTLGNLTGVQQQGNSADSSQWRPRSFQYDSLSRLLTTTNPESGTICYGVWQSGQCVNGYDNNGNLIAKTAPAPNQTGSATVTTSYGYDPLNRLAAKSYSSGGGVVYLYDQSNLWGIQIQNGIGRLSTEYNYAATGNGDSVGFVNSYDVMGQSVYQLQFNQRIPTQVNKEFSYTYNLDGSLKTITYPSGRVVTYQYNQAQRPISAVDGGGVNFASAAQYTAGGALSSLVNGGVTTSNSYNLRLQPVFLSAASLSQTVLNLGYDFTSCNANGGNNGNVCQLNNYKIGQSARSESFQYDALNRLTQAWTPNAATWRTSYLYDPWGNLLQKAKVVGYQDSDPQAAGMGTNSVNGNNQVTNWCYDAAGNLVGPNNPCSIYASNHTAYENVYDGENRLTKTTVGGVTTSYDYDANGRRVKKIGSTNTLSWYGLGGVLEETDLSGNLTNEYIFFGGKRIARYNSTNGYSFYSSDHLGSADVVTDALGNIKEESDYYPFGGERTVTDLGINNDRKFTGKERDPETGCDFFGARYYCNPIGRFLTPDWAAEPETVPYANFGNPQSLNLYSYVNNNPTSSTDLDGHCDLDGEHHGWLWCAGHALGLTLTQKEKKIALHNEATQDRETISQMKGFRIEGMTPQEFAKSASDAQVEAAEPLIAQFLLSQVTPCGPPRANVQCDIVFPVDFATPQTENWSATFQSEGEARAFARTKLGGEPVEVEPGKWRSRNGKWQYRAKPGDVGDNHIHLEEIDPQTGEVIQNLHLRWPQGKGR